MDATASKADAGRWTVRLHGLTKDNCAQQFYLRGAPPL